MHIDTEPTQHIQRAAAAARAAAHVLARSPTTQRDAALHAMAAALRAAAPRILAANATDLAAFSGTAAFRDRLVLNPPRVEAVGEGRAARLADRARQRLDLIEMARPARHADAQPFAREGPRDRRTEAVARADDEAGAPRCFPLRHRASPPARAAMLTRGAHGVNARRQPSRKSRKCFDSFSPWPW